MPVLPMGKLPRVLLNLSDHDGVAVGISHNPYFDRLMFFHHLVPLLALHHLDHPCIAGVVKAYVLAFRSHQAESCGRRSDGTLGGFRLGLGGRGLVRSARGGLPIGGVCGAAPGIYQSAIDGARRSRLGTGGLLRLLRLSINKTGAERNQSHTNESLHSSLQEMIYGGTECNRPPVVRCSA